MTILFIQAQGNAVNALKSWQPELVGTPLDDNGDPLPEQVLVNTYTTNWYIYKGPGTFLRRRPDPPADPETPAPPIPPGHLLDNVYTLRAMTPVSEAIAAPILEETYARCMRAAAWMGYPFEPQLTSLPVHTHAMRQETRDVRHAWQLVGELFDTVPPTNRNDHAGAVLERAGVRVEIDAARIRTIGRQGTQDWS